MQLSRPYAFWFLSERVENSDSYMDQVKLIGSFTTVQDFWKYYQHMVRPDKLPEGTTFYAFAEGVKPMWEDPANIGGGRFQMRVKLSYANQFWEDLLLGLIGNQCEHNEYINGVSVSTKDADHVVLQIWVKARHNQDKRVYEQIDTSLKQFFTSTLSLTDDSNIKFRPFPKHQSKQ